MCGNDPSRHIAGKARVGRSRSRDRHGPVWRQCRAIAHGRPRDNFLVEVLCRRTHRRWSFAIHGCHVLFRRTGRLLPLRRIRCVKSIGTPTRWPPVAARAAQSGSRFCWPRIPRAIRARSATDAARPFRPRSHRVLAIAHRPTLCHVARPARSLPADHSPEKAHLSPCVFVTHLPQIAD